jgi:DNA adenine methylase
VISKNGLIRSPLRYPGGKSSFYKFFIDVINRHELKDGKYFEPFAGGAGIAIALVSLKVVSEVILNDIDYHIYCFWLSILSDNERFIEEVKRAKFSIPEWRKQKKIYEKPKEFSVFQVGFSTFYLNRCNRSGILTAGPIGGYAQDGYWKLNARFNKEELIQRIVGIGKLKDYITVKNMDAILFLKKFLPNGEQRKFAFVYIDPPYISAGDELYLNHYALRDHKNLAKYLLKQTRLNWITTYDDSAIIRQLYSSCQKWLFHLNYSVQTKRNWLNINFKNLSFSSKWKIIRKIKEH